MAAEEYEEERSTVDRPNAVVDTPVDREEEEETAAWEGEVTIWFAERVGGALDNYGQL